MKSQTTIQSWPVRKGCSTLKGGDAHGGEQTLGLISASTMKAVYLKGISMPVQIQAVPIGYREARINLQEAANFKITQNQNRSQLRS